MKEFNLEKALAGEPVVTRDGRKVKQIHHEENCKSTYSVIASIADEGWVSFKENGKHFDRGDSSIDLFMASVKKAGWINLYKNAEGKVFSGSGVIYKTKEEAEKIGKKWSSNYITTVKLELGIMKVIVNGNADSTDDVKTVENKMKPFDLEKALAGYSVITRDGHKVTQIHYEKSCDNHYPITAYIEGKGWETFRKDGRAYECGEHRLDLFMESTKKEGWVNLYTTPSKKIHSGIDVYKTKEEAEKIGKNWGDNYMDTVKIEWRM